MKNEKPSVEQSRTKNFELSKPDVDRMKGFVTYKFGGQDFRWYLEESGRLVLKWGNIKDLDKDVANEMRRQVFDILKPELEILTKEESASK